MPRPYAEPLVTLVDKGVALEWSRFTLVKGALVTRLKLSDSEELRFALGGSETQLSSLFL